PAMDLSNRFIQLHWDLLGAPSAHPSGPVAVSEAATGRVVRVAGVSRGRSAQLDADHVAGGIAHGAVANPVRLVRRLLHDLGAARLEPVEDAVEVGSGQDEAGVGALGHHLGDDAALVVGDAGVGG